MQTQLARHERTHSALAPRPIDPAPSRSAPYETRADWSERYVAWFIAQAPLSLTLPRDVGPTHLFEVEFNTCVRDPQRYERMTVTELDAPAIH